MALGVLGLLEGFSHDSSFLDLVEGRASFFWIQAIRTVPQAFEDPPFYVASELKDDLVAPHVSLTSEARSEVYQSAIPWFLGDFLIIFAKKLEKE